MSHKILRNIYGYARELVWYLEHKIKQTSYVEYYALRMDRIVSKNSNWGLNLNRSFQLDYLISQGLDPSSSLLDYGCGALSAGIYFIEYLDNHNYSGVDVSSQVLSEAERRLQKKGLFVKQPNLYLLNQDLSKVLNDKIFDYIWAQSVFTHMPPDDIHNFFRQIKFNMHKSSKMYTSFAITSQKPTQRRFKDWYYNKDFFIEEAFKNGFHVEFKNDWFHPDDPDGKDVMACFTLI